MKKIKLLIYKLCSGLLFFIYMRIASHDKRMIVSRIARKIELFLIYPNENQT